MAPTALTLSEKLKIEWPVMITIIAAVVWLGGSLSTINERLIAIETRLQLIERSLPPLQAQVSAQGERLSRLEATR